MLMIFEFQSGFISENVHMALNASFSYPSLNVQDTDYWAYCILWNETKRKWNETK